MGRRPGGTDHACRPRRSAWPATLGSIAPGQRADLVLWTGDPLDVSTVATQVWMDGRAIPMRSRQTELRDRYLRSAVPAEQGGMPRAYPATEAR